MNISTSLRFIGVSASGFSRFAGSSKCFLCSSSRRLQDVLSSTDGHRPPQADMFPSGPGSLVGHQSLPLMTSRPLLFPARGKPEKQAWLETLSVKDNEKLGIINLHPDVFATYPRIDILWWNIYWQQLYRKINYEKVKNRAEMRGGGRKPWPQKGSGRARHGSIRSPLWHGGGKAFGPRGPKSYFFMLPIHVRVLGLRVALSVKYAQDNLHIVDSLDLPSDEPSYLRDMIESRGWGLSVLFVDDTDIISRNMALATDKVKEYNVMPVYGLNVYSMLKHETLVLTLAAVERIEEKLLQQMHNQEHRAKKFRRTST